jgi:hypothetical protein
VVLNLGYTYPWGYASCSRGYTKYQVLLMIFDLGVREQQKVENRWFRPSNILFDYNLKENLWTHFSWIDLVLKELKNKKSFIFKSSFTIQNYSIVCCCMFCLKFHPVINLTYFSWQTQFRPLVQSSWKSKKGGGRGVRPWGFGKIILRGYLGGTPTFMFYCNFMAKFFKPYPLPPLCCIYDSDIVIKVVENECCVLNFNESFYIFFLLCSLVDNLKSGFDFKVI